MLCIGCNNTILHHTFISNFVISIKNLHCLFTHSQIILARAPHFALFFFLVITIGFELIPVEKILQRMLPTCSHCLALPFVHLLCLNGLSRCYPIWYRSCGCFNWCCSRFCCYVFSIYSLNPVDALKETSNTCVHCAYRYFAIQSACS